MTLKKFNSKIGTISPKVECKKCHRFFVQDDEELICISCQQSPEEEKQVTKQRKERQRMKDNGI
jgi:Zn finger protein HypA/HybF involved in hydrogenase expression